ncbi:UDP-N-acetylmuramate--L-alanine ligase [Verrucomicrobiota bacterium]
MNSVKKTALNTAGDFLSGRGSHVHMLGICGVGMAGLAYLLKARGFEVTGCDASLTRIAEWLSARGIDVLPGHESGHIISDVKWLIRSSAVPLDNSEIGYAKKMGVPIFSRGAVLAALLAEHESIAVAGTHGKTTTSTFITQVLKSSGRDPAWCVGGEAESLGGVAGPIANRESRITPPRVDPPVEENLLVVEADESDGTLALYEPDIAVITNIEFDHMEHFKDEKAFKKCFQDFIGNTKKTAVYCTDDPGVDKIFNDLKFQISNLKLRSYGFSKEAFVRGKDLEDTGTTLNFMLVRDGIELGCIELPVPGRHNALNALAAAAVVFEQGLSFQEIQEGFGKISLPRRRFERIVEKDGIVVISDYAHHPSEIAALVRTAEKLDKKRLLAVFQPHRFTRTLALGKDFPESFKGVDQLILTPVYAASEKPLKGGAVYDLYSHFRQFPVSIASSLEQAWEYLKNELREGDVLLVIGAGDVESIASWARDAFQESGVRSQESGEKSFQELENQLSAGNGETAKRRNGDTVKEECLRALQVELNAVSQQSGTVIRGNEPLAKKTTLKVGGSADIWTEINSVKDLSVILKWCKEKQVPFNVMGAGSNILVSDLGVRGIVARLTGAEFNKIQFDNTAVITVGASVPLSRFLNRLEGKGVTGLEFLEGIPGTVGGALRMNAGAWEHEICEFVSWIRYVNKDGLEYKIAADDLDWTYRRCVSLEGGIAVEAGFKLAKGDPAEIKERRRAIVGKREWMKGLRSAGSIFKNPSKDTAGELIDKAGLKGMAVGGAEVPAEHANIITVGKGACASDVWALIEKIRAEVKDRFGIYLETEIVLLRE